MRTLLRPTAIIEAWFDMLPPGREASARELQAAVLAAGPELQQAVKWGNLVFSTRGAHAFAIVPHKTHLHLQVFRGASLERRFPQLEGGGKGVRHLRLRYGAPLDEQLIHDVVHAGLELTGLPADVEGEG